MASRVPLSTQLLSGALLGVMLVGMVGFAIFLGAAVAVVFR